MFSKLRGDCDHCRRSQDAGLKDIRCHGIDSVPECPTGEMPKLAGANRRVWWLFQRMLPALFDSMGGINTGVIRDVLEIYGVPDGQRPVIYEKALVLIEAAREMREKEKKHG